MQETKKRRDTDVDECPDQDGSLGDGQGAGDALEDLLDGASDEFLDVLRGRHNEGGHLVRDGFERVDG